MTTEPTCHLCRAPLLRLEGYPIGPQVTSDCRPWQGEARLAVCQQCGTVQKPVTETWLQEVGAIYAGYAVYDQGGGAEQASFDPDSGVGMARSQKIVAWLQGYRHLPPTGSLLDIGCGNGAFLRAFGRSHPQWRMAGLELDGRNRSLIESIPGVTQLHVGPAEDLRARFDLVVLIHALEHIPNPIRHLQSLFRLLNPGGLLFIEVPDLEASPFDLLIADHCTHFTGASLRSVVREAGFQTLEFASTCVVKELSLLAQGAHEPSGPGPADPPLGAAAASRHLAWLREVLAQGEAIPGTLGIFGSSISATWLAAALGDRVGFFVDEDPNRVRRQHLGRPIFAPGEAPRDAAVLMPLRADIAAAVATRLSPSGLRFLVPPGPPSV